MSQKCDAGRGQAAYMVEIPRGHITKRDQEAGAQVCARLRLCSIHAQNVLDKDKNARAHELRGWLDAHPCGPHAEETDDDE